MSLVLYAYYHYRLNLDLAHDEALSHVSESHGITRAIVEEALKTWESKEIINVTDGSQRALGRKGRTKAPPGTGERLQRKVRELNAAGRSVTAKQLQAWLASPAGEGDDAEREPVLVSLQTVRNWLHSMGYVCKEPKRGYEPTEQRKARVREYLIDLAQAHVLEKERETHQIVYMDESYVHVNHKRRVSWVSDDDERSRRNLSKGQRVIIVHAITEDGPLIAPRFLDAASFPKREGWFVESGRSTARRGRRRGYGRGCSDDGGSHEDAGDGERSSFGCGLRSGADGEEGRGSGFSSEGVGPCKLDINKEPTCEMLFPSGDKAGSDYHKNMDAETFMKWVENRLVPAFRECYPEKKMVLVLDNAPYHHGMAEGWKSPLQATKSENLSTLRSLGVSLIKADRDGQSLTWAVPTSGAFPRAPRGPDIDEVRRETFRALKKYAPDRLLTRAEKFFQDNDLGHLLYTPPYCPDLQPIELFWAYGKGYVARTWSDNRNLWEVTEKLREGFYGKKDQHGKWVHPPADCKKLIEHSRDEANKCVDRDAILKGRIDSLKNVPEIYKVSKDSGLDQVEDSEELDLLDVDVGDES